MNMTSTQDFPGIVGDLCTVVDGQRVIVNRVGASEAEATQIAVKYGLSFTDPIHWHA